MTSLYNIIDKVLCEIIRFSRGFTKDLQILILVNEVMDEKTCLE